MRVGREVQTYDPTIQLFSDTYDNISVKKFCPSSLLPKLRGGHPLEDYNIDQSEGSNVQSWPLNPVKGGSIGGGTR